jgi:hypothetical protein
MSAGVEISEFEGQRVITGYKNQAIMLFGGNFELKAVWHCQAQDEIMVFSRIVDGQNVFYGWTRQDNSGAKTFSLNYTNDQVLEMLGIDTLSKFANFLVTGEGLSFANTGLEMYRFGCGDKDKTIYPFHFQSLEFVPSWLCWYKDKRKFVLSQKDPQRIMRFEAIIDSI